MQERIGQIIRSADERIATAADLKELSELKVNLLGKKGELTALLKSMGQMSPDERPAFGKLVNEARELIESKLETAHKDISAKTRSAMLSAEAIDVTMPGRRNALGRKHPMTIVIDEIKRIFMGMGYEIAEGPDVETDYYNFEALNIPKGHTARDEQDTFYIDGGFVLRTQTSPVQVRVMEKSKPPIRIIAPGKVYRSDEVDATHTPVFHQIEGLVVDKGITMGDLKGTLEVFARELFGADTKVRFYAHHFRFTEPSAEMEASCFACHGSGCRICKGSGYIEILGCGMVHPRVLEMSGIDPNVYTGFAFGGGLERIAMQRFDIPYIRLLYENDVRFLSQF